MNASKIKPKGWYTAREAAGHLGVTEETVKIYCRRGDLAGKRVGPRKKWHILGSELQKKRKEWELDEVFGSR